MGYGEWEQVNEKIRRKIFPPGQQLMSMLIELKQGGSGPEHAHPHEQLGFVIQGKIEVTIEGVAHQLMANDQILISGNLRHAVLALEDSLLLETFTPLRKDLLK